MTWHGEERRHAERRYASDLSDEQKAIAAEAARQALEIIYAEIGRSAITFSLKLLGAVGVAVVATVLTWLGLKDKL